jgi:alcohol dehydrogenase
MSTTEAAVLEAPRRLRLKEFDLPHIDAGTGILRVEVAGICTGTDSKLYDGKLDNPWPIIPGHEIVGVVESIGDALAETNGVQAGDRVILRGSRCGRCAACRSNEWRFCPANVGYGLRRSTDVPPGLWGGYARHVFLAPGAVLHRIDAALPPERALMGTVLANAIFWTQYQGGVRLGTSVVVQGVGQQGIAAVIASRHAGARPIVAVGLTGDERRLELAQFFGADVTLRADAEDAVGKVREATEGRMADVVVEVTGAHDAFLRALDLVHPGGTIVYASLIGREARIPVPMDALVYKQIRVQGVYSKTPESVDLALAYLKTGRVSIENMITHRLPLRRAAEAIELAGRRGEVLKVVLVPEAR